MTIKEKILYIFCNAVPILLMIFLIPILRNDYVLTFIYVLIIGGSFIIKYESKDLLFFIFGFIAMTISEYLFVSTGVETFTRKSFFGLIPLWLPFLWAYGFVVIKRAIIIINR